MPLEVQHLPNWSKSLKGAHRMHALFVHGMGRTPLSGLPLLWHLERAGLTTSTFGYVAGAESFARIKGRLIAAIGRAASQGSYIVIGHSLGGVLLRAALDELAPAVAQPDRVFLLGSPVLASRLAQRFSRNSIYRLLTGDCGNVLASPTRMASVGRTRSPTTSIAGVGGVTHKRGPFGGEPNDGVVSISEISADWIADVVRLPVVHTLLPASKQVAQVILARTVQQHAT